jgi:hypothetical protein
MNMLQSPVEERVKNLMQTIYRIRNSPGYIAAVVQNGKMHPKLHAIAISCAEENVSVPLLALYPEFQVEVDKLTLQLTSLLVMFDHSGWVSINTNVIAELKKYDIEVIIETSYANGKVTLIPYAIFEAAPKLRFAF